MDILLIKKDCGTCNCCCLWRIGSSGLFPIYIIVDTIIFRDRMFPKVEKVFLTVR